MSLIDAFRSPCVVCTQTKEPDGEGGFETVWTDGKTFSPAIVRDKQTDVVIADREQVDSTYTITFNTAQSLPYHSVFKRKSDGKTFRVVSDEADTKTPACASFQFKQVKAVEWRETQ